MPIPTTFLLRFLVLLPDKFYWPKYTSNLKMNKLVRNKLELEDVISIMKFSAHFPNQVFVQWLLYVIHDVYSHSYISIQFMPGENWWVSPGFGKCIQGYCPVSSAKKELKTSVAVEAAQLEKLRSPLDIFMTNSNHHKVD